MLPRLRAEESLTASQRIAVGTGSLKTGDARAVLDGWRAATTSGRRIRGAKPSREDLRAIGIGVRLAPKKADTAS